jgi:hypothetical protein
MAQIRAVLHARLRTLFKAQHQALACQHARATLERMEQCAPLVILAVRHAQIVQSMAV